ncbi:Hypothetical predicted protein [Mytilus galloprovincialis]|uniref:Uncharacterized protein n=1 Tax=Mytilus galloprovincialis TaxID=29158 RepID=A0A8B6HLD0_MYTGA|nr:Hypothetical predicted protein [Mytilus galloprovincialis]
MENNSILYGSSGMNVNLSLCDKWPSVNGQRRAAEAENRLRSVEATSKCLREEDQKRMQDNIVTKLQPEMEKLLQQISAVNSKAIQQPTASPTMVEPLLDDRKVQHRTRTPKTTTQT